MKIMYLNNTSISNHSNEIGVPDRAQSVRNNEGRSTVYDLIERLLDNSLRLSVKGAENSQCNTVKNVGLTNLQTLT